MLFSYSSRVVVVTLIKSNIYKNSHCPILVHGHGIGKTYMFWHGTRTGRVDPPEGSIMTGYGDGRRVHNAIARCARQASCASLRSRPRRVARIGSHSEHSHTFVSARFRNGWGVVGGGGTLPHPMPFWASVEPL